MSSTVEAQVRQIGSEFVGERLVGTAGVFYKDPNEVRFEVALNTAEQFRDAGIPYVVIDASPGQKEGDNWVSAALGERGAFVFPAEVPGIATQRQQGVAWAVQHGAEKVVGLEPEKPTIPRFADEISEALNTVDVLVIGRTAKAESSLPPVQQQTERLAAWILRRTHDLPPDALAGPRGFTVAGAEVLAAYPATQEGKNNWLYLYETPLKAKQEGLSVGGIALDMIYPESIVAEETGNPDFDKKRYDQFTMQLGYLLGEGFDLSRLNPEYSPLVRRTRSWLPKLTEGSVSERATAFGQFEELIAEYHGYQPAERLQHVQ